MRRPKFNVEPKTAIPIAANIVLGGVAAYFAGKSHRKKRQIEHHEKVEKHLMKQATHDELTGVLNKRGLEGVLASNKPPRAMLYADSTYLKEVNDTYGHSRGDEAIIETARILKESLRPGDIIARTGEGDEFLVLLDPERRKSSDPLSPQELLEHVTTRVYERTQELLAQPENSDLAQVGFDIAVGGAVWEQGMSIDDLRTAADSAMYQVKKAQHSSNGGNPHQRILF